MDSSNVNSAIPAFDYLRGLASLRGQIDAAVCGVLDSGRLILGPEVSGFEAEFADFVGSRFAVGVGSGTDALILALRARKYYLITHVLQVCRRDICMPPK